MTSTANGLNVGGDKITNVADGSLNTTSTDAVNGSQLNATNTNVTTNTGNITTNTGNIADLASGKTGLVRQDAGTGAITVGAATGGTSVNFIGTDGVRTLSGLANGNVATGSTEAVTGDQLNTTNTNITDNSNRSVGNIAALGDGAAYNAATDTYTAPSYLLDDGTNSSTTSTFRNVGDALGNLDTRTTTNTTDIAKGINVGDGTTDNNFALGDTINVTGDSNLTSSTTADGVQVSLNEQVDLGVNGSVRTGNTTVNRSGITLTGGTNQTVTLSNDGLNNGGNRITKVADGIVSDDAVNKGQLDAAAGAGNTKTDALGNSTASNLGGNAAYDSDTGIVSAPTYTLNNGNNDAITTDFNDVGSALGNLDTRTTVNTGDIANVQAQADLGFNISAAGGTNDNVQLGENVNFTNTDSNLVVTNTVDNGINYNLADNISVTQATIGDTTNNTVLTSTATGLDVGGDKITNVADGTIAAGSTDAVTGNQLNATNADVTVNTGNITTNTGNIADLASGKTGLVRQDAGTGAITVGAQTGGTSVNFSGTAGVRTLSGLANGNVVAGSTEAVTGDQLNTTNTNVTDNSNRSTGNLAALGGNAAYDAANNTYTAPSYTLDDGTNTGTNAPAFNNVGDALGNLDTRTTTNTADINKGISFGNGTTDNNFALGNTINVTGDSNLTSSTTADGVQVSLNESVDLGANGSFTTGNSVLSNTGLTITGGPNVTSAGINAAGNKITNVDDGTDAGDAVNFGQLEASSNAADTKADALGNSTASNLGGGATYNATTGAVSAPSYTLDNGANAGVNTTVNNVGAALTNLDGRTTTNTGDIDDINAGRTGIVRQDAGTGAITVGAQTGGTSVSFANVDGDARQLTGVASAGDISLPANANTAVNAGDVNTVVTGLTNTGLQFSGDSTTPFTRKLGEELKVRGGATEADLTDNNIGVVASNGDTLTVKLNKDINLGATGSVTTGNTTTNTTGVRVDDGTVDGNATTITAIGTNVTDGTNTSNYGANGFTATDGITSTVFNQSGIRFLDNNNDAIGPSITASGIDAGGTVITGVADGTIATNSTDAINGGQLAATNATLEAQKTKYFSVNSTGGTNENNEGATGEDAIAIGKDTSATGFKATAVGSENQASASGSSAFGTFNDVSGEVGSAFGVFNNVTGPASSAIGAFNNISGEASSAVGIENTIDADNAFVIGNNVTIATGLNGAVGIGSDTTVTASTLASFAPTGTTVVGTAIGSNVVSIGNAGSERRLTNVAAGGADTDAVNVSQLKGLSTTVDDNSALSQGNLTALGGNAAYDASTGVYTAPVFSVVSNPSNAATNVRTVGDAITALNSAVQTPLSFTGDNTTVTVTRKLGQALVVKGGAPSTAALTDNNIGVVANGVDNSLTVKLAENINLGTNGSVTTGNSVLDTNGLVVNDGIGDDVTNLSATGTNVTDSTNTSNYGATGFTATDAAGHNGTIVNQTGISFTDNVGAPTGPNITAAGIDANNTLISNVATGVADGDAVNKGQLDATATAGNIKTAALGNSTASNLGGNATYNATTGAISAPSYLLDDGTNQGSNAPAFNNIGDALGNLDGRTTTNTSDIDDINAGRTGIVRQDAGTGAITVGAQTGGTSVSFTGTDGVRTLSGLANGNIAAGSTEAVTGDQLNSSAASLATVIGGNATNADGIVTATNIGGTGVNTIDGAISSVKDAATKAKSTVTAGKNITVSETVNTDGSTDYEVKTKDDLALTSVTTGNTVTNTAGVSIDDGADNITTMTSAGTDVTDGTNTSNYGAEGFSATDNAGNNGVTVNQGGISFINGTGDTTGPIITAQGINANDTKITNLTDGSVASDAATFGQLTAVAGGITAGGVQYDRNTDSTVSTVNYDKVSFAGTPAVIGKDDNDNNIVVNGGTTLTNIANGINAADAVNKGQLDSATKVKIFDKNGDEVTINIAEQVANTSVDNSNLDSLFLTYDVEGQEVTDRLSIGQTVQKMNTEGVKFAHTNAVSADGDLGITNDSSAGGANSTAIGVNAIVESGADSTIALGFDTKATTEATNSVVIGKGSQVNGASSVAIGDGAQANGTQSISVGTGNIVNGNNSGAFGDPSIIDGNNSYSVGNNNTIDSDDTFVFGNNVTQTVEGSVVLGTGSAAITGGGIAGFGANSNAAIAATTSTTGAVAVGNADNGIYRQITGVAAGTADSDAVNVSQLKAVSDALGDSNASLNNAAVQYDKNPDDTVNKGSITLGGGTGGTTITNVANGVGATDAVNKGQLDNLGSGVAGIIGGDATYDADGNLTANNIGGTGQGNISDAIASVNQGNAQANEDIQANNEKITDNTGRLDAGISFGADNGDNISQSVGGNSGSIQFEGGNNITTSTANGGIQIGLDGNIEVDSITTGNTVVDNTGVTIKDGPSMTTEGFNAANTVITGVEAGTNEKDAVNFGQLTALDKKLGDSVNALGYRIGEVEDNANAGISAAMAMSSLPQAYIPGKSMVGGGIASYNGESAVAVGVSKVSDNGRWVIKVNGTADTQGNAGGAIGAGFHF
ncbi:YadA-like family protein [Psychrobacter sp. S1-30-MNA-CIBAN-0213]|uniref:beta strand repeat-containing protein n=1 Tax=Psychrobacter sp. S1-30-MNA-CIBAN-0213 TaxID=3140456 RepID=UPI0033188E24